MRTAVKGCDAVLHLAALIAIPYSYHSPDAYVDTNIKGTLNILQAARDLEVERCIHTSTSEVYGTAQFVPITEEHPLQGQSPYSATKIAADQLALSFYRSFGQPVSILRPFNTYGPRQSARAVIPTIITQIANGARRIKLGSLHPTRDFTYVTDTADAFIAMLAQWGRQQPERVRLFDSLGVLRYLSAAKYAACVVGNSSSGIIEIPSLGVPVVNIGDRQQGRIASPAVLHCPPEEDAIVASLAQALTPGCREHGQPSSLWSGQGRATTAYALARHSPCP